MRVAASLVEKNQHTYDSLYVSLLDGLGTLQLLLAVCDNDALRYQIIERYERELAQEARILRVKLDPTEPSLRQCLQTLQKEQDNSTKTQQIVTVLGAEQLDTEALKKFWGYLQWTREGLREFSYPIVLWVPMRLLKDMAKKAPDFWSWRNGIFLFEAQIGDVPQLEKILVPDLVKDEQPSLFSVEQLEDSLQQAIAQWGEDNSKIEPLYAQLGKVYAQRVIEGKFDNREQEAIRAEQLLQKAVTLQSQQPEYLATALNNLAYLYHKQGKYSKAEPLYRRALAIYEQQLGADHPHVATSLNNLAALYLAQGKYSKAEPLYQRSLAIYEQQLGTDSPNVAASLNNLAGLYHKQGKYNEAEPLYRQALAIYEQQLGADHPHVAASLNNLAGLYQSQGKYSEAEPLYQRSLAIYEQQLGTDHPDFAQSLNNLAELYRVQGKYSEVEPLCRQALAIREQQLGQDHPNVAQSLNNLAELYRYQGKYSEVEPLYRRALAIYEQQLGPDHPDVATILNNLALFYESQGKYSEAENMAQKALVIYQGALGKQHPNTLNSLLTAKALHVQNLLQCDKQTLIVILQSLAQQANLSKLNTELNTESMLMLLDSIATNPELQQRLREASRFE